MNHSATRFSAWLLLPVLTALAGSFCAHATDGTNQWNVQVVGVMVVTPEGSQTTRSFCWKPGVTVAAVFAPTAGKIVHINTDDSRLESFTDNLGTDLMAAPPSKDPFNKPGLSCQSANEAGGESSVIVDLKASGRPVKGATSLNLAGKFSAQIATSTKTFTLENVVIKTNTSLTLGDLPVIISAIVTRKNPYNKKDEFSVTFSSLQKLDSLASLDFFDATGRKIEAQKRSWGGGLGGSMVEYVLPQDPGQVRLVATCWQNLTTVKIPFSFKTSVGL